MFIIKGNMKILDTFIITLARSKLTVIIFLKSEARSITPLFVKQKKTSHFPSINICCYSKLLELITAYNFNTCVDYLLLSLFSYTSTSTNACMGVKLGLSH